MSDTVSPTENERRSERAMVCDERPKDADVIQKDWLDELLRQESSSPTSASDDALVFEGKDTFMRDLAGAVRSINRCDKF